jgi:CubicO group peptidase (beta-lactamase class C family)
MRRDTLFRISSTTKPMTAAVVLSLVDDGLLELNGPADDLLPELASGWLAGPQRCRPGPLAPGGMSC